MLDLPSDFSYRMLPEAASGAPDASNMVQLKDVCFGYEEGELLLRHLNLEIPKGFFLGIAGPSGCGKSSLKNCDEIIVMDHGQTSQRGSFDGLLSQPGIFGDMYYGRLK